MAASAMPTSPLSPISGPGTGSARYPGSSPSFCRKKQEKAEEHGDTSAAVAFRSSAQTGRKAKAARGNRGGCRARLHLPRSRTGRKASGHGIPGARREQVLASLMSLAASTGDHCANTAPSRMHATARTSPVSVARDPACESRVGHARAGMTSPGDPLQHTTWPCF